MKTKFKGKRTIAILLSLALMLGVAGCGGSIVTETPTDTQPPEDTVADTNTDDSGKEPSHVLKISLVHTADSPVVLSCDAIAEGVMERTDGDFKVEVYPASTLAGVYDGMEQAYMGANIAIMSDPASMGDWVPEMQIIRTSYAFDGLEQVQDFMENDSMYQGWVDDLSENHGYQVLSFGFFDGEVNYYSNKKVEGLADMANLRIRAPGAEVTTENQNALGAKPTGMAWSEVYTSLQQGVIDGVDAQTPGAYTSKLHEVAPYMANTGHIQLMTGLVVGTKWFETLPEEYQQILIEETEKGAQLCTDMVIEQSADYIDMMVEEGLEITEVDKGEFKEAVDAYIYDAMPVLKPVKEYIDENY